MFSSLVTNVATLCTYVFLPTLLFFLQAIPDTADKQYFLSLPDTPCLVFEGKTEITSVR